MTNSTHEVQRPGNDTVRAVHRQITAAAFLQASLFGRVWSALAEKTDGQSPSLDYISHANHGYQLLLNSIGLNEDLQYARTAFQNWERPISSVISLTKSGMDSRIADIHGPEAAAIFLFTQALSVASIILKILSNISGGPARQLVREEVRAGHKFLAEIAAYLRTSPHRELLTIGRISRETAVALTNALHKSKHSPKVATLARTSVLNALAVIQPHVDGHDFALKRAIALSEELRKIKAGPQSWKSYEDLCHKILWFCFVPTFRQVYSQVRSDNGRQRRDAVLPSVPHWGLWSTLRTEYQARHIACEFKNVKRCDKYALHQIRLYLDRPTIGRFGLLFVRNNPSDTLLSARKRAYEERKQLILILSDDYVYRLLWCRAYLGSVELLLEQMKLDFELSY